MFVSTSLTLSEATDVVNARTGGTGRGPIWEALKEGALHADLWEGSWHNLSDHKWRSLPPERRIDPPINWPVSPYALFPNLPTGWDVKIDRRALDKLWPETPKLNDFTASDRTGAPGRPNSAHLVEAEFKRRAAAGDIETTLSEQAKALSEWLGKAHPTLAQMVSGTIENRIRTLWRDRLPRN